MAFGFRYEQRKNWFLRLRLAINAADGKMPLLPASKFMRKKGREKEPSIPEVCKISEHILV